MATSRLAIFALFFVGTGVWYAATKGIIHQTIAFIVLLLLTFAIRVLLSKSSPPPPPAA